VWSFLVPTETVGTEFATLRVACLVREGLDAERPDLVPTQSVGTREGVYVKFSTLHILRLQSERDWFDRRKTHPGSDREVV
jgi:hypothetical protein